MIQNKATIWKAGSNILLDGWGLRKHIIDLFVIFLSRNIYGPRNRNRIQNHASSSLLRTWFSDKNQQFPTLMISANKITYFVFKK